MKIHTHLLHLALCLLTLVLYPARSVAQGEFSGLVESLKTYHYGDSTAVLDKIVAQVVEARLSPDKRREAARTLAAVLPTNAAFEAKQFACRQLVFVADDEQIPALAGLLADRELAHYALLVLARIHSPAVGNALAQALPGSTGRTEVEVLDTLADLGDARAIPAATERLSSKDPALHDAAVSDLAKLAGPAALQALRGAYGTAIGPAHITLAHALLTAASRLQQRGDGKSALEIYDLLERNPASPILGAAALRGIASVRGEQGLPLLFQALAEEGTRRQDAAATLLREIPGHVVAERLGNAVKAMHGEGQLLALEILGDRADPVAAPAVTTLCRSADPKVRLAALHAAGSLGDSTVVPLLLSVASSGTAEERSTARDSLVRLRGAAVDRALLGALDTGAPSVQIEAIQAIGQRGTLGAVPRLLNAARSANAGVSAAALRILRDQGTPTLLPALVDLLLATPPENRDAALDAVTQIARRSTDARNGMLLLLERLAAAAKPADRVTMVSVVGQVGGPGSIEALRKASADPSAAVRVAVLSVLAEWPNDDPMNDLLRSARTAPDARQRAIALRGYLRMAGSSDLRRPTAALALFKEVSSLATHPEEKRLILAGLAKIPSIEALEYAVNLRGDREVRAEAELAVVEIGRATIGAWPEKTLAALEPIARAGVNADARARAEATLAISRKFGDYVVAWEVSPSYQRDGADYTRLFDIPFPAEDPDSQGVPWRPMPVGSNADQPWLLDLLTLWGGEQRVAYLRTAVRSETARDLMLEMGSDDGLKAWWNGQVVVSHNVARAVAPGQEKVTVHAKPGWNQLLLKVTQNNQGWGACARFTNPDGSPTTGLKFAAPSAVTAPK